MVNVCFWLYIVTTIIIRHYRSFATNNNIYSIITCDGSNIETWKSYLKLVFDFQSFSSISSAHLNMKEIRICTVVYGWQISTLKYCIVYSNISYHWFWKNVERIQKKKIEWGDKWYKILFKKAVCHSIMIDVSLFPSFFVCLTKNMTNAQI